MTRLRLAVPAVVLLAAACSTPEGQKAASSPPPPASPAATPLAVHVAVPEGASDATTQWARDLEAAIRARAGDLVLVADPSAAALVVRILSVEKGAAAGVEAPGEGESMVMRGALVVGDADPKEFNLTYRGDARPQAEALARNLHQFGTDMRSAAKPPAPASPSETPAATPDSSAQ